MFFLGECRESDICLNVHGRPERRREGVLALPCNRTLTLSGLPREPWSVLRWLSGV